MATDVGHVGGAIAAVVHVPLGDLDNAGQQLRHPAPLSYQDMRGSEWRTAVRLVQAGH